ncbi:DUF2971 domain-containing protein [Geothrix alkalitolerans]|uniref:DUF2971 domain-containing protein n=1 Tax=Geothrix alkalitolerans TaxID=2922724 RepID=UPI001FAF0EEA|nr:DUF2971 domain-containing protein [Geothrix alkalitolerans]
MLYKYLPEARIDVLEKLAIRFTQPKSLNDPFESRPLIDVSSKTGDIFEDIKKEAKDLWNGIPLHERTPENRKKLQRAVQKIRNKAKERLSPHRIGLSLMDELNEKLGILSLSRTFSNLLMWSHYADGHKGFVIGFDSMHKFFRQKSPDKHDTSPYLVSYTTQRSLIKPDEHDAYTKVLCQKPLDWAYEEEVRIFRNFSDVAVPPNMDKSGYPIYLVDIPDDCIKKIFIGAHASPNFKNRIIKQVFNKIPKAQILEMKMSDSKYQLECHRLRQP